MKLVIGSKIPSWWIETKPRTIDQWWNGLEWQDYLPNGERMYFNGCASDSLTEEAMCMVDLGAWELSDALGIDWLYKIAAHTGAKVRGGIDLEVQNIMELVNSWMSF